MIQNTQQSDYYQVIADPEGNDYSIQISESMAYVIGIVVLVLLILLVVNITFLTLNNCKQRSRKPKYTKIFQQASTDDEEMHNLQN